MAAVPKDISGLYRAFPVPALRPDNPSNLPLHTNAVLRTDEPYSERGRVPDASEYLVGTKNPIREPQITKQSPQVIDEGSPDWLVG